MRSHIWIFVLSVFFGVGGGQPFSYAEEIPPKGLVKSDFSDESGEDGKKKGKESSSGNNLYRSYMDVGVMTIPIVKRNQVEAYIRMKVQVITKDGSSIEPFRPYKQRLYDVHFTDIYSVMSDRWVPSKDPASEVIQKRLTKQTDKVVGSDQLKTVLTSFYFYKVPKNPSKMSEE